MSDREPREVAGATGHLLRILASAGGSMGKAASRRALGDALGRELSEAEHEGLRGPLLAQGLVEKGKGRDQSLRLAGPFPEGAPTDRGGGTGAAGRELEAGTDEEQHLDAQPISLSGSPHPRLRTGSPRAAPTRRRSDPESARPPARVRHLHRDERTNDSRVAFEFPEEWPDAARELGDAFRAALEQRQVDFALQNASKFLPGPHRVLFCAFEFDPEAAKDIDEKVWPGVTMLRVGMDADLLTDDLKQKARGNDLFWRMDQPEVLLRRREDGWSRLKRTNRAELDEELRDAYHGTVSLPFEAGGNRCVAVEIVDDRGIESLETLHLD